MGIKKSPAAPDPKLNHFEYVYTVLFLFFELRINSKKLIVVTLIQVSLEPRKELLQVAVDQCCLGIVRLRGYDSDYKCSVLVCCLTPGS